MKVTITNTPTRRTLGSLPPLTVIKNLRTNNLMLIVSTMCGLDRVNLVLLNDHPIVTEWNGKREEGTDFIVFGQLEIKE
jgi:hypothetical protein